MKPEAIIITPVKNSLETTKKTIKAIYQTKGNFLYFVFNDFSNDETKNYLQENQEKYNYQLINLEDLTQKPSPNYRLVLIEAQKMAIERGLPLIIIESDVIIKDDTIINLLTISKEKGNTGLLAAITIDKNGDYNFPYNFVKNKNNEVIETNRRLSFCCTLLSHPFLQSYNFNNLSEKKDWYDIHISRVSIKNNFTNYIAKGEQVLHLPHSSRPWKLLKYKNPILYYFKKHIFKRDKI